MMEISLQTKVRERRSQIGSKCNTESDMNGNISTKAFLIIIVVVDAIVQVKLFALFFWKI